MADEQKIRNHFLETEPIFGVALASSKQVNYLGSYDVLDAILRVSLSKVFKDPKNEATLTTDIKNECTRVAKILLGFDNTYVGVHHWNEPGYIDEFCAKWIGSLETHPVRRMEHSMLKFYSEVMELVGYISTDGVLPEQWQWQLTAIVQKYIYWFTGVDTPSQAALALTEEQPGTIEDEQEEQQG